MRILYFICCLVVPILLFSQDKIKRNLAVTNKGMLQLDTIGKNPKVATMNQYRFISIERDTTYLDTSLTIQKEYSFNYLRKDIFGLLPFSNEGQTYNTLQYSLNEISPLPEFGFKAKHFNFLEANHIKYSSVATPVTELYFK